MPVKLIAESANDVHDVELLTKDGELKLEAQVINDFLTHADFGAVFENEAAKPHIVEFDETGKLVSGDKAIAEGIVNGAGSDFDDVLDEGGTQFLPGDVAAQLVDPDDLVSMFEHYVDTLPDDSLEDKARLAAVGNLFGITEKFARGAFKKMARKGKAGHANVARMMLAMLNKGAIKRAKTSTGGYGGGGYEKGPAYKKAAMVKASNKAKIARYKKANVGKQKKAALAARRKMKEDAIAVFGHNVPVDESSFEVATVAGVVSESTRKPIEGRIVVESQRPGASIAAGALTEGARLAGAMSRLTAKPASK